MRVILKCLCRVLVLYIFIDFTVIAYRMSLGMTGYEQISFNVSTSHEVIIVKDIC